MTNSWTKGKTGTLAIAIGLPALIALILFGCGGTPQIGADEEVFRTVDALFTAVTAQDEKLLVQCEQRLQAHQDAGKLPADASEYLRDIIAKARSGNPESAAERLYRFMGNQRREGLPKR